MIAYNRTNLDNMAIREQSDEAFAAGCISQEENARIGAAYPVNFYEPNIFIRIGLFLLTVVIASFSLGLLLLISAGGSNSFAPLLLFSGILCYGALEFFVYQQRHFRSGVDDGLLWMSAGLLYGSLFAGFDHLSTASYCIAVFLISFLFTLRFANGIMALVTYASLLAFIFSFAPELGRTAQLLMPFIIMAGSAGIWWLSVRFMDHQSCRHYRLCLTVIKTASLAGFYLSGNYFVVREMSHYMFGVSRSDGVISMGWFFWILTVATPLLYIYKGIRKKDHIYLWAGLTMITCTVFTIRQYYHVLPAEWAMMTGGIGIIALAYGLMQRLRIHRLGITSLESSDPHLLEKFQIESLVIAETFAGAETAPADSGGFQFGGGSGGGGGAGGQF